jgi:two-component system OmpR family response regulator
MTKVLLVDDDTNLSSMLAEYLGQDGFAVQCIDDGALAVQEALNGQYSIVVLDVMMPSMNGVEVLRRIRARSKIPVLMLTARGDDVDRIIGLELGADDYVAKPCTPRELSARLKAILRRVEPSVPSRNIAEPLEVGPLRIWPERRVVEWDGEPLEMTGTEYNLLEVLTRNAGRVVSKSDLSEQALGRPLVRFDRCIDVHVSSIRHKLPGRSDGQSWIRTVRGMGYQLIRE